MPIIHAIILICKINSYRVVCICRLPELLTSRHLGPKDTDTMMEVFSNGLNLVLEGIEAYIASDGALSKLELYYLNDEIRLQGVH
ncbi:hypothetical protein BpHYR1_004251 [Brachionus plicatilis]|uniref:Uncharacterized protein n=1 Tax=Brachionus plicatilis TaxID=10195 RepID=A0A3M7RTK9_BRAPC|nr:hypothetical protein BpHYR1_004251 [Brachionus plicatilis]